MHAMHRSLTIGEYFSVLSRISHANDSLSNRQTMPGKTGEKGGKVEALVLDIRKRKGLKPEIPTLDQFYDKL